MKLNLQAIALYRALIALILLTAPGVSALTCLESLKRDLSFEWEFVDPAFRPEPHWQPWEFGRRIGNATTAAFHASKFKELYNFYGQNNAGEWVRGLIPASVAKTKGFAEFAQKFASVLRAEGDTYVIQNWESLDAKGFQEFVFELMNLRGKSGPDLKLRKVQSAWPNPPHPLDALIPEEISEEWNNNNRDFANIEFPMVGAVKSGGELFDFALHLWDRLGLKPDRSLEQNLAAVKGHVHWLSAIPKIPDPDVRQRVYRAVVGYWGDANDAHFVSHMNPFGHLDLTPSGELHIKTAAAENAFDNFSYLIESESFGVLRASTYNRVEVGPEGLIVKDKMRDLKRDVDPNFPPEFKLLPMGLRGIYGQSTLPPTQPIPKVGLEARGYRSTQRNLAALPKKVPGKDEVDVDKLLRHETGRARGMMDDSDELKATARKLGLDPSVVDHLNSAGEMSDTIKGNSKMMAKQRAIYFLPLNDWLSHPLAQEKLNAMGERERAAFVAQYEKSRLSYVSEINRLMQARANPYLPYQPKFSDPLPEFPDGINRVFPRRPYPDDWIRPGDMLPDPDIWFRIVMAAETARFMATTNLDQIIKMPD